MNVTKTEALVLQQLASAAGSELYGLEMVKASDGALRMGSIYVLLDRLQRKGFVSSEREVLPPDAQRPPRRLYKITGTGARVLHAYEALQSAYAAGINGAF
jgi:DNA-binding PadR family transcriptional regulator